MIPNHSWRVGLLLVLVACAPNLGAPASLVDGMRILAVRGTPPEQSPSGADGGVTYDVLLVTPEGTVPASTAQWDYCLAPLPPAENNLVNDACLASDGGQPIGVGAAVNAELPSDTCALFGPLTPPLMGDAGAGRPPDPDGTGGYYQPVRVEVGLPDGGTLIAFGDERISCGLAGVTVEVSNTYAKTYTANNNPTLASPTLQVGNGAVVTLTTPDGGTPSTIPEGATVTLSANWPATAAESFPVLDLVSRELVTQREALIASFFVTAGSLAEDEVEVSGTDFATTAPDQWTAPSTAGLVHLWVVLRDSRGGVDFQEALLQVQ